MTHVTIADVIFRRVPLTAREAVTLTLAVAGEWDRQHGAHGPISLPDVDAIQLHDTGAVSFLDTPGRTSAPNTLGALLGRLLGNDETESSRHGATLGAMVKAPGVAAARDVPSVPDDSFRSVLTRFVEDDCATVVAAIVQRAASVLAEQTVEVTPPRARTYTGPERRQQPRLVAELRLDIRELERELFALRSTPKPAPHASRKSRRVTVASLILAGAATCVLALLMIPTIDRDPSPVGVASREAAGSGAGSIDGNPRSASTVPVDVKVDSTTATEGRMAKPAVERTSVSTRRGSAPRRPAASKPTARPHSRPTFAGGARSITWLRD